MGEVQTENIRTRKKQLLDHLKRVRCGTKSSKLRGREGEERGEYFGLQVRQGWNTNLLCALAPALG
jgi:hypothetical protein